MPSGRMINHLAVALVAAVPILIGAPAHAATLPVLTGVVVDVSGTPLPGISVIQSNNNNGEYPADITDENGTFSIQVAPDNSNEIGFYPPLRSEMSAAISTVGNMVPVSLDTEVDVGTVEILTLAPVSLTALDVDGDPVRGVKITGLAFDGWAGWEYVHDWAAPEYDMGALTSPRAGYHLGLVRTDYRGIVEFGAPEVTDQKLPTGIEIRYVDSAGSIHKYDLAEATYTLGNAWVLTMADVNVPPATAPDRVARPTADVTGSKVVLRWTAPNDNGAPISKYIVRNNRGLKKAVSGDTRKLILKRLKPNVYKFSVVARNPVGASAPSPRVRVHVRAS